MIIEMPSFQDYITLKQKVAKLEKRNNYLAHRVSELSKRLGINHGSKNEKGKNHDHDRAGPCGQGNKE